MTETEAKEQLNRIFTTFPSYAAYVRKQDDPVATVRAWCHLLKNCDSQDVIKTVDAALQGDFELRHKFDSLDMLPIVLRGRAMRLKEDRQRFAKSSELAQDQIQRKNQRSKYKYHLGELLRQCRRSGERLRDGKITKEQHEKVVADCRQKARMQCD